MSADLISSAECRVSVVIPTYARPVLLQRAIDSALAQTYNNVEVIVVDDNNPGTVGRSETEKVLRGYFNDKRVLYIRHDKNMNGAAARNTGIKASSGALISFLDDDDYYSRDKVEVQVAFLNKNPDYMGVYCGRVEKGRAYVPVLSGDLTKELLCLYNLPTSVLMFRKVAIEQINGFDESYRRHQDYEFLLRYFQKYLIGVVGAALVTLGDNEGENAKTSQDFEELKSKFLGQFDGIISELDRKGILKKSHVYACHYAPVFWSHLHRGHLRMALKLYFKMFCMAPVYFNIKLFGYFLAYMRYCYYRERNVLTGKEES